MYNISYKNVKTKSEVEIAYFNPTAEIVSTEHWDYISS